MLNRLERAVAARFRSSFETDRLGVDHWYSPDGLDRSFDDDGQCPDDIKTAEMPAPAGF